MGRPRDDRQKDLLRPALDRIIDMGHPLVRLANEIDWSFLDQRFSRVCVPAPGDAWLADLRSTSTFAGSARSLWK